MKTALQLFTSAVAAGTLLASLASHATDISELPLKASVLAKPNVVFGMDDSGSMDAEVMINNTFQAWFYGNTASTTMYPGSTPRNGAGVGDHPMLYLFPNGTGTGNKVFSDPSSNTGYAVPPTPELAWLRTSAYNPLYYDSSKTYAPWSPAYVGGAVVNYPAATSGGARSHPALGSTTTVLNADLASNTTDWRFTFTAGMTIPTTATNITCQVGSAGTLPYLVSIINRICQAKVTYYPATFWRKEVCVADGVTCVAAYDGNTVKRYEIKAGNSYPSGRTFADEMQNFANWFTYYRKRRLMLAASMGQVLENITGLRMGVVAFNAQSAPTMYDSESLLPSANRLAVAGRFYINEGASGTPTHGTMAYIYNQFNTNNSIIQYACQTNAQFIITDGFANDATSLPPAYSTATYGATSPYTLITPGSLHDKALAYFTLRLRATGGSALPAGRVPLAPQAVTNPDPNTNLHLRTYALTLGMKGTLWPNSVDPFVTAPLWPLPVANTATMIDDLWHATINGRGQMYLATDAAGTAASVQAGLNDIISQTSAQSGVAVSTVNLVRGDSRAYFGQYNPSGWTGDVVARAISATTGVVDTTQLWSANSLLTARDWTTRVIASYNGSTGVGFSAAAVGATVNPGGIYGTNAQVIDYLRGERTNEGTLFRKRVGLMGAVINSEPYISNDDGVLYVASGEGMLHAIDIRASGSPGKELWAFVPRQALVDIGSTSARSYSFKTQLDGSPVVGTLSSGTKLLVAGMGASAGSFYALDVSAPRALDEATLASKVKWEFPAAGDSAMQAKVGQALGRPVIAKTTTDGDVVLVTSGYNSTADGKGRMWMLNANTGAVIKEFVVAAGAIGAESGLAHVAAFDEGDGVARYAYGGDLLGNLWRFDMQAKTAPDKVAVLTGPGGQAQGVTTAPELAKIEGNRVIFMPTGRILGITDFGNNNVQSIYAIKDGALISPARSALVAQTYTRATDSITSNAVDWATGRGWYMDLPAGEHANTQPQITYSGVAFVTNVAGGTDCSASSYLYLLDVKNGGKYPGATFVGSQVSAVAGATSVTTVITSDGKARGLVQDYNGGNGPPKTWNPPPIPPSKTAWREMRRQ